MKTLELKLTGIAPLITHCDRAVNPFGIEYKTLKPLTAKRNKTDADLKTIARLEWEAGLYIHNGKIVMPAKCVLATIVNGAKRTKNGKLISRAVFPLEEMFEFTYDGPQIKLAQNGKFPNEELDLLFETNAYLRPVIVQTKKIIRCRPIFYKWGCIANFLYDEDEVNESTIISCTEDAGRYIGLCDWRPIHGRFEVEKL